jgi:hypothetical protein
MGYTHYFNFIEDKTKFSEKELEIVQDIVSRYGKILQLEEDESYPPIIDDDLIKFNGIGEDGHETFYLETTDYDFNFCKTNRKPYDLPICEILLVLKSLNSNDFKLESDGFYVSKEDAELFENEGILKLDGNWDEAIDNVKGLYGIKLEFKLKKSNSSGHTYYSFSIVD